MHYLPSESKSIFDSLQVTVSKARKPGHNRVYKELGVCNDRYWYQHANGVYILFDAGKDGWILTASAHGSEVVYSRESEDDDIFPPNGEWRCHSGRRSCNVKASYCTCTSML